MSDKQSENGKPPWPVYATHRSSAAQEEAKKYPNQWIAWSADGTRIIAHHEDPMRATQLVLEAGLAPEDVVMAFESAEDDTVFL
jgi:hypothetical protein